jgi:prepilin peptidase CpaA
VNLAIPIIFLIVISATDIWKRKIPNLISIPVCIVGLAIHAHLGGVEGIKLSGFGMLVGFFLFLLPFLMSGMGAGDVKGFAALGALIGPSAIFQTFLYTALIGGVVSLVYIVITCNILEKARAGVMALGAFAASRDPRCLASGSPKKKHKFPYAPAMLLGYLAYLAWGNLV